MYLKETQTMSKQRKIQFQYLDNSPRKSCQKQNGYMTLPIRVVLYAVFPINFPICCVIHPCIAVFMDPK